LSLSASWAGGVKGREVMDRLFVQAADLMSDKGLFYVVVVQDNDPGLFVFDHNNNSNNNYTVSKTSHFVVRSNFNKY